MNRSEKYNTQGKQTEYRKWNKLLGRYDVYDSNNRKIGHYKYNSLLEKWEYTKSSY